MKILLAPSKTRCFDEKYINHNVDKLYFLDEANYIANEIKCFEMEELSKIMKIRNKLLETTFSTYQHFEMLNQYEAIRSYNGAVYKGINVSSYNKKQIDFLNQNVRIFSALYGLHSPFDGIKPYRLDMKMKVLNETLYKYWGNKLDEILKDENLIINLSSAEFSKMISLPMVTVVFKDKNKIGEYKINGTYSKIARGIMVNYIINHSINTIKGIKGFKENGYHFCEGLSNDKQIVFLR